MGETVYWAELQSALSGVGLSVVVDMPRPGYPWLGKIDDRPFTMTIPPKNDEDGFRDFLVVSLYGQEEEKVIPFLSKFMNYEPFCKYKHRKNSEASATYEWDRKDPTARLKELEKDQHVYDLHKLDKGLQAPQAQDLGRFFQQFTPEIVKKWEEAIQKNPDVKWNCNRIRDILPFVRKVMPRIGQNQSLFALSIISLDGKIQNEREVILYGLEPLLTANILTKEEAEQIVNWYFQTQPTWDSGGAGHFQKGFEIEGVRYRLITGSVRNCRDLNLQALTK